jgi:hypothetical protein
LPFLSKLLTLPLEAMSDFNNSEKVYYSEIILAESEHRWAADF